MNQPDRQVIVPPLFRTRTGTSQGASGSLNFKTAFGIEAPHGVPDSLRLRRVRDIFGYPGDGINGVFGAMNRAEGKLGFVQARHEEMA